MEQHHYTVQHADGSETKHFGMVIAGAAISLDPVYRQLYLEEKATEICGNIEKVSRGIADIDPQSGHVMTTQSLQTLADHIMATHVPSDTAAFAATVDAALRRAHERNLGVDLLDETGHRPNGGPQDDPTLTRDRALLRTSSGGAGFRPISDRLQALNSLCLVLPQLIDKTDRAGKITPGFFNDLTSILGTGSFDEGKEETRWEAFLNSGSAIADEFMGAHTRHKAIHDELRQRVTLPPGSAPLESIFDKPIGSFGVGLSKVQKLVMDERHALQVRITNQRMCNLSFEDHRRKAWLATSKNEFGCGILGPLEVSFTPTRWRVTVSIYFGLPQKTLNSFVGSRITVGGSGNPVVDTHGHNLLSHTHSLGGGAPTHHNNMINVVSQTLEQAGVKSKSKGKNGGVSNIFKHALSGGNPLGENGNNKTNGIIPDMVVIASAIEDSGSTGSWLGGANHLVDFKTHASTSDHNNTSTTPGLVGNIRQRKVNTAYHSTAKELDALVHDTPSDERGPIECELDAYGREGRVLGPVIGVYGSGSSDLGLLRDLAASELARKHTEQHNMDFFQARAMFKNKINRSWGQHIARGWASMLLDRLRDYVILTSPYTARPAYSDHYGPDSGEVIDQFNHFHDPARGNNHDD